MHNGLHGPGTMFYAAKLRFGLTTGNGTVWMLAGGIISGPDETERPKAAAQNESRAPLEVPNFERYGGLPGGPELFI